MLAFEKTGLQLSSGTSMEIWYDFMNVSNREVVFWLSIFLRTLFFVELVVQH